MKTIRPHRKHSAALPAVSLQSACALCGCLSPGRRETLQEREVKGILQGLLQADWECRERDSGLWVRLMSVES